MKPPPLVGPLSFEISDSLYRLIQTKRHNNIQNIIMRYMKLRMVKNMRFKTNSTVNLEGKHLGDGFARLKPDIIAWDDKKIIIVEFSCPYDRHLSGLKKVTLG